MIIIAPGQQERLPQALGGLEEERTYLLKLTRALLEKLEERYLGGRASDVVDPPPKISMSKRSKSRPLPACLPGPYPVPERRGSLQRQGFY
jgi:hypothetical protein